MSFSDELLQHQSTLVVLVTIKHRARKLIERRGDELESGSVCLAHLCILGY